MELMFKAEKVHVLPEPKNNTLAYVDLSVNDNLVIKGLRVCTSKNGLFVSFPQTKGEDKDGKAEWYNNAYLKNKESDKAMQAVVLKAYEDKKPKND